MYLSCAVILTLSITKLSFVNDIICDIAEEKAYGYFTLIADFHKKVKELIKEDGSYNELCDKFQSDFNNAKTNKDAIAVCRSHLEELQKNHRYYQ